MPSQHGCQGIIGAVRRLVVRRDKAESRFDFAILYPGRNSSSQIKSPTLSSNEILSRISGAERTRDPLLDNVADIRSATIFGRDEQSGGAKTEKFAPSGLVLSAG